MTRQTLFVSDFLQDGQSDSQAVRACLAVAKNSINTIIFKGQDWLLNEAVLIPSNTTIIVDACTIRQADDTFDNIFRGDNLTLNPKDPYGQPLNFTSLENIKIIGKRGAALIGPERNRHIKHPDFVEEQELTGDWWGWRTHQISLSACTNVEIGGFYISRTRGWAMSFDFCEKGFIHDIHFNTHAKNGDGVNLRCGCRYFRVENISGYVSDDMVACTGLYGYNPVSTLIYPSEPIKALFPDDSLDKLAIHNIEIRNIRFSGIYHAVICLAAGGVQVHDITIDTVSEADSDDRHVPFIFIYTGYGTDYKAGDLHNINVSNVSAKSQPFVDEKGTQHLYPVIGSNAQVRNVNLRNIRQLGQGPVIELKYPDGFTIHAC